MARTFKKTRKQLRRGLQGFWDGVVSGNPLDIALLAAGVLLVVALVVVLVLLLGPKKQVQTAASLPEPTSAAEDNSFNKEEQTVDETEYAGTILAPTADKGEAYLMETLFVGDSNTARMPYFGPVTLANTLGASSMGIQHVTSTPCVYFSGYNSPVSVAEAVKLMQPKRIIINFGTNNAGWDAQSFYNSYEAALKEIQAAYPYAEIVIAAVHPVAKVRSYPNIKMQNLAGFNKALVSLAENMGLKFLNSTEALTDESGFAKAEYMEKDGIHLNAAGMKAYFAYVSSHAWEGEDTRPPLQKIPQHLATPDSFFGPPPPPPSSSSSASVHEHKCTVKGEVIAPTCTAEGFTRYYCEANDGAFEDKEKVPATGVHVFKKMVNDVETITEFCIYGCGTKNPQYAHVHKFTVKRETVAPTAETEGYTRYYCEANDGAYEDRDKVPKLAAHTHKFTVKGETVAPTAETEGYTRYYCEANDGAYEDRDKVPKLAPPSSTPPPPPASSTPPPPEVPSSTPPPEVPSSETPAVTPETTSAPAA